MPMSLQKHCIKADKLSYSYHFLRHTRWESHARLLRHRRIKLHIEISFTTQETEESIQQGLNATQPACDLSEYFIKVSVCHYLLLSGGVKK